MNIPQGKWLVFCFSTPVLKIVIWTFRPVAQDFLSKMKANGKLRQWLRFPVTPISMTLSKHDIYEERQFFRSQLTPRSYIQHTLSHRVRHWWPSRHQCVAILSVPVQHTAAGALQAAAKTLKDNSTLEDRSKFLQEAAIMGQFKHRNVVELYGVVAEGTPVRLAGIIQWGAFDFSR